MKKSLICIVSIASIFMNILGYAQSLPVPQSPEMTLLENFGASEGLPNQSKNDRELKHQLQVSYVAVYQHALEQDPTLKMGASERLTKAAKTLGVDMNQAKEASSKLNITPEMHANADTMVSGIEQQLASTQYASGNHFNAGELGLIIAGVGIVAAIVLQP